MFRLRRCSSRSRSGQVLWTRRDLYTCAQIAFRAWHSASHVAPAAEALRTARGVAEEGQLTLEEVVRREAECERRELAAAEAMQRREAELGAEVARREAAMAASAVRQLARWDQMLGQVPRWPTELVSHRIAAPSVNVENF